MMVHCRWGPASGRGSRTRTHTEWASGGPPRRWDPKKLCLAWMGPQEAWYGGAWDRACPIPRGEPTHLSGRHSTVRAGSPSGCHRWSRCPLWWLFWYSDPRRIAGLHSTHCPEYRAAERWANTSRPAPAPERPRPAPAPSSRSLNMPPGEAVKHTLSSHWGGMGATEGLVCGAPSGSHGGRDGRWAQSEHWKKAPERDPVYLGLPMQLEILHRTQCVLQMPPPPNWCLVSFLFAP